MGRNKTVEKTDSEAMHFDLNFLVIRIIVSELIFFHRVIKFLLSDKFLISLMKVP